MSVWLVAPSARPVEHVAEWAAKWRECGYKVAVWRDVPCQPMDVDLAIVGGWVVSMGINRNWPTTQAPLREYPGYATAINALIEWVRVEDPDAEWFIAAGDDVYPDPNHTAEEIAAECADHFRDRTAEMSYGPAMAGGRTATPVAIMGPTFGVMQPTGDRFAGGSIDRIAGSAWIGREFARRAYGGNGPLWPEYTHMFVDEELQEVAKKLGVFWQRPDLIHLHRHYQRFSDDIHSTAVQMPTPPHMEASCNDGYTREHWIKYKAIFQKRKAEGFPGSEVLA